MSVLKPGIPLDNCDILSFLQCLPSFLRGHVGKPGERRPPPRPVRGGNSSSVDCALCNALFDLNNDAVSRSCRPINRTSGIFHVNKVLSEPLRRLSGGAKPGSISMICGALESGPGFPGFRPRRFRKRGCATPQKSHEK